MTPENIEPSLDVDKQVTVADFVVNETMSKGFREIRAEVLVKPPDS